MASHLDGSVRGPFVGRVLEMRALGALQDDGARLVTIIGTAGVGKTRLAIEWARASGGATRRGRAEPLFCDLSEATTLDDLCAVVGRALGVPLPAGGSTEQAVAQLGRALAAAGERVVILDNLEQLTALASRVLRVWRELSPEAWFVVTSRERIRIEGEACLPLDPLGVPPADERSLREIAASDAVALFVARARAVRFGFELTEADAPAIAAIVRQVDGIPLAIELCAARTSVLAPPQILARLARRFELLAAGVRGAPARQATLRGAIDWSWDLLDPREQDALAQCSVFRGGFSLEAAEAVLDLGRGRDGEAPPVLDVIQSLHDKSLVRAFDAAGAPAERRYGLLESIHAYAEERLAERSGVDAAIARHEAFFLAAAGPRGDARRRALDADNLIAVCTRALDRRPLSPEDADTALRALLLLEPVLLVCARGRLEPYAAMLDAALAVAPREGTAGRAGPAPAVVRAQALYTRAFADLLRGRVLDCMLVFKRALDAAREAGSRADEARALTKIGLLFDQADHPDEARRYFEEARAIVKETGDPALAGDWMLTYAGAFLWRGRAAECAGHAEQALESLRAAGDLRGQSIACAQLAQARLSLGRLDDAERAAADARSLLEATEDRRTEAFVLGILGRVAAARGRFGEARAQIAAAIAIHRAVGDRWSEGVGRGYLGDVAFEEGHLDEAAASYREALALLQGIGERHYAAVFAAALGAVEAERDRDEEAATWMDAATRALDGVKVVSTNATVQIHRGFADVARARRAAGDGDAAAMDRHLAAAVAKIALASAPTADGAPSAACSAEDVRLAIRLLERAIDGARRLPRDRPAIAEPVAPAPIAERSPGAAPPLLVVGPEARWFRVRDGEPVRMLKARAARLMLFRLVRCRLEAPGRALPLDALFEAGWPGERIPRQAAANRVHVTLTKLRKVGLAGLLLSRDDGFLLDPAGVVLEALGSEPG
ncbi:MAG: tetratricopeptide repeat protein [Minicystis sp.]